MDGREQDEVQFRRVSARHSLFASVPADRKLAGIRGNHAVAFPDRPIPARPVRSLCEESDAESAQTV